MKSTNVLLSSAFLLSALTAHVNAAEYPPQDHGGADLILADGDVIWGLHTGIDRFEIPAGNGGQLAAVNVAGFDGDPESQRGTLKVYAEEIVIEGILAANGVGFAGGGGGGAAPRNGCLPGFGREPFYTVPLYAPLCEALDGFDFEFLGGSLRVDSRRHYNGGYGDGPGGGCPQIIDTSTGENLVSSTTGRYFLSDRWPDMTLGLEVAMGSGGGGGAGRWEAATDFPFNCAEDGGVGGSGGGRIEMYGKNWLHISGVVSSFGLTVSVGSNGQSAGSGGSLLFYGPISTFTTDAITAASLSNAPETLGTIKVFSASFSETRPWGLGSRKLLASIDGAFPMATTFFEANHNWKFFSINGYPTSIPSEDSPTGALFHQADGPESLGIWQSPVYTTGKEYSLVRARFTVHSPTPAAEVPTLRMRSIDDDMTETAELWVDSRRDGLYSPTADGHRYEQFFELNDGDLRFAFDMLHFQVDDANDGEIILEILEATDVTLPEAVREERVYTFEEDTEGWSTVTVPGIEAPVFSNLAGTLGLQAGSTADVFGFWTSPGDVTLDPDRLYIATFYVTSDNIDATQVPAFRCRLNESGFDTAAVLHISSEGTADRSPTLNNYQQYRVYLKPSGVREDSKLLVSFDLVSFMDDDPETTVSLREVRIESVALSDMPQ